MMHALIVNTLTKKGGNNMDNKVTYLMGFVTYISKEKVDVEPKIFSTGQYSLIDKDKKEIIFDFNSIIFVYEFTEDDKLYIKAAVSDFDQNHFAESNLQEYLTIDMLNEAESIEYFYECFLDEEEKISVDLEMEGFELYGVHAGENFLVRFKF